MSRHPRTISGDAATDQALLALARLAIEIARNAVPRGRGDSLLSPAGGVNGAGEGEPNTKNRKTRQTRAQ